MLYKKGAAFLAQDEKHMKTKTRRPGRVIRFILILLLSVVTALFLLPLTWHIHNAWVVGFAGCCLLALACAVFWPRLKKGLKKLWKTKVGKVLYALAGLVVLFAAGMFVAASVHMLAAAYTAPEPDATLIVLGAQVQGDHPSLLLADRLNQAVKYMRQNPGSAVVVCGGQGADEHYTEASIMKEYLVNKGIGASRIYEDDTSANTRENVANAAGIIRAQGLSDRVVTVTQEFHQYRSQQYAKGQGLTVVGGCTARTPFALLPLYWMREYAGISRYWLMGL